MAVKKKDVCREHQLNMQDSYQPSAIMKVRIEEGGEYCSLLSNRHHPHNV